MRTFTNGHHVLEAIDLVHDTWTFEQYEENLPPTGRASWWGAFRRGDHIQIEVGPCDSNVEVRLLGKRFCALIGAIVGRDGGAIEFEVPQEGVYHLRLDGVPRHRVAFRLEVRVPMPARRALKLLRPRSRPELAS